MRDREKTAGREGSRTPGRANLDRLSTCRIASGAVQGARPLPFEPRAITRREAEGTLFAMLTGLFCCGPICAAMCVLSPLGLGLSRICTNSLFTLDRPGF